MNQTINKTVKEQSARITLADLTPLLILAVFNVVLHSLFNHNYGFHRDELATVDDAQHLAWGYVAYPPLTPFVGRIAFELFGESLTGLRFFAVLAISVGIVLTGLAARELGASRWGRLLAALAAMIAPVVLVAGSLFQYVAFDYLWWVCIGFCAIKLCKTDDARWWLGLGIFIGLGMQTKYTVGFLILGVVVGTLLTRRRVDLESPWLWAGALVSLLIWLPNLLWQYQHDFVSLEFLRSINARDVRIGRTENFLGEQFFVAANFVTVPLWLAGLWFYLRDAAGKNYRLLGWMYVVPLALMFAMNGRSYYLAPAYPMLFAGGVVLWERWLAAASSGVANGLRFAAWGGFALSGLIFILLLLPIAPVNSDWWKTSSAMNDNFREQIGWTELIEAVAEIYQNLPAAEKPRAGILAGNYGEAGAINLYGRKHGLPRALSNVNSYWLRGYPEPPPETLIVVGFSEEYLGKIFRSCNLAGRNANRFGVENEESRDHPNIFVCRELRQPWAEFWKHFRAFG